MSDFDWTMVPRYYPAFDDFFLSTDGTVWVRRMLGVGLVGFDVFGPNGQYLGQPKIPKSLGDMDVQVITASDIYAIETGDLGVDYVVRLGISSGSERTLSHGFSTGCR